MKINREIREKYFSKTSSGKNIFKKGYEKNITIKSFLIFFQKRIFVSRCKLVLEERALILLMKNY